MLDVVVVGVTRLDADSLERVRQGRFLQQSNETAGGGIVFLSEALDEFFRELFGDSSAAYDIMGKAFLTCLIIAPRVVTVVVCMQLPAGLC